MSKFIEVRDVEDKKHLVGIDKIIDIYEGQYVVHTDNGRCEGWEGYAATYIKCVDEKEIPTYETLAAIKLKIEGLGCYYK